MPFRAEGHALDRVLTADNGCPKRPSCCGIPEDDCLFCLARGHFVGTERGQHSSIWAESYALSVDITFLGRCIGVTPKLFDDFLRCQVPQENAASATCFCQSFAIRTKGDTTQIYRIIRKPCNNSPCNCVQEKDGIVVSASGQYTSVLAKCQAGNRGILLRRCSPRDTQRDSIKQAVKQKVAFGEEEAMV